MLQLLARLTKRHPAALTALAARAHVLLLSLPAELYRPELEPFMAAILRHMLEDPATLQACRGAVPSLGATPSS